MNKKYLNDPRYSDIQEKLKDFDANHYPLSGLLTTNHWDALTRQIIASCRRVEWVTRLPGDKPISQQKINPNALKFDPLIAASYYQSQGMASEAIWLTFLAVHFGKTSKYGWNLVRQVYGGLGSKVWNWMAVRGDPEAFIAWLDENALNLQKEGKFGNHRKYMSLKPAAKNGTQAALRSFVTFTEICGGIEKIPLVIGRGVNDPGRKFKELYESIEKNLVGFSRMGAFDLSCMLGKLNIINAEPDSTFIVNATGPLAGASLLFNNFYVSNLAKLGKNERIKLEKQMDTLAQILNVPFACQVVEDAVCNWQKDPNEFVQFLG